MPEPDEDDDRPPPRARRRDPDDRDDRDDDRPRRRRYRDDDDDEDEARRGRTDATGGLIPYKNGKALAAYYCGVFGLISCVIALGIFGVVPIVLGFLGLKHARTHPEAGGKAHAITGIVLGIIEVLTFLITVGFFVYTALTK